MKTYSRVQDGVVMELVSTDGDIRMMYPPAMTWIDCTSIASIAPGWVYDGGSFAAPPPPPPPPPPLITRFTSLEYIARFTAAEQVAIATAAQTNAQILLLMISLAGADNIDITDAKTAAGLDALVAAGLIGAPRKTTILTP